MRKYTGVCFNKASRLSSYLMSLDKNEMRKLMQRPLGRGCPSINVKNMKVWRGGIKLIFLMETDSLKHYLFNNLN